MASRFRRWRGRSGKTYTVSVFTPADLPDYDDAVILAVDPAGHVVHWVGESSDPALASSLEAALRAGAREMHVHLLAGDAVARQAVLSDLDSRH